MLLHHVFAVLLLAMAYIINGVQIGTLILLAHDISDVPLEVIHNLFMIMITISLFVFS